jgi:hypothetical protein
MVVSGSRRVAEFWLGCEKLSTGFSGVLSGGLGFLGVCLFGVFFEWVDCYFYSVVFGGCAGCFGSVLGSCPEEAPSDDPEEDDDGEEHYYEGAFAHVFLLLRS